MNVSADVTSEILPPNRSSTNTSSTNTSLTNTISTNTISTEDVRAALLQSLLTNFSRFIWLDYLGLFSLFCFTILGFALNAFIVWVLRHIKPISIVDLIQLNLAVHDCLNSVVGAGLFFVARFFIGQNPVQGLRFFCYYVLIVGAAVVFEGIATIFISYFGKKQVGSA